MAVVWGADSPDGPLRRLDPRVKIASLLTFVFFFNDTATTEIGQFLLYLALAGALIALAQLPLLFVLGRSLVVVPFVLLVALFIPFLKGGQLAGGWNLGPFHLNVSVSGLWMLWNVFIKAWTSVLIVIVLSATTTPPELLQGLQGLRVPRILVLLLSFLFRYLPLLVNQVTALSQAAEARGLRGGQRRLLRVLGQVIGTLFIRTYERGERVHFAMLTRGFKGEVRTVRRLTVTEWDVTFATSLLSLLAVIKVGVP